MRKKQRPHPKIALQGGVKVATSVRISPNDLATIREGAAAANETPNDTISRGAVARARMNLMRAAVPK